MLVETASGSRHTLDKPFAEGGEAAIWSINGQPKSVAKIFHTPLPAHEAKLVTMLAHPPAAGEKLAVAWPTELLYSRGRFVGYQMPRVSDSIPIFNVYNPARRKLLDSAHLPRYPWPYVLHHMAKNLAAAVKQIHAGGHVIGDLNESNVLVNNRAIVTLVDADSFQIQGSLVERARMWPLGPTTEQEVHHNAVGKAEFTAPELQGVDFKSTMRTPEHDHFALSALIFYLLMEGYHPYAGVMRNGASVGRVDLHCMKNGVFPYDANQTAAPPPRAPQYQWLHPDIRQAFRRTFVQGHNRPGRRPTADEWLHILRKTETAQISCETDQTHIYYSHLNACPECAPQDIRTPLLDSQKLAHWFWLTRRAAGISLGVLWAWLVSGMKRSGAAASNTVAGAWRETLGGSRRVIQSPWAGSKAKGETKSRKPKWSVKDFADTPLGSFSRRGLSRNRARLWLSWTFATTTGGLLGALIALGVATGAEGFGMVASPLSVTLLTAALVGLGVGRGQQPILRAEASRLRADEPARLGLGWTTGTGLVFLLCSAIGEAVFGLSDQVMNVEAGGQNLVYWALLLGLAVGFVQSLWLSRHFERSRDRRRWAFVSAVGWVLVAYATLYGREWGLGQSGPWMLGGLLGATAGMLGYALLTGIVLAWMARGPLRLDHSRKRGVSFPQTLGETQRGLWGDWQRSISFDRQNWYRTGGMRWAKMLGLLAITMVVIEQLFLLL